MSGLGTGRDGTDGMKGISLTRDDRLVLVLDTPKGRGIFAGQDIPARTVIEVSPVLVLDPVGDEEHIRKTELYNYTYNWPYTPSVQEKVQTVEASKPPRTTTQAIIFGLGSMFNHSTMQQNVGWERDLNKLIITYVTLRDIKAGEELCISYGSRLTFKDTDGGNANAALENWTEAMNMINMIDMID